jgi:hypothetical protein
MTFYHTQDYCVRCGSMYRLKPIVGNFAWACDCPPPQTYTNNNTGPDLDRQKPRVELNKPHTRRYGHE